MPVVGHLPLRKWVNSFGLHDRILTLQTHNILPITLSESLLFNNILHFYLLKIFIESKQEKNGEKVSQGISFLHRDDVRKWTGQFKNSSQTDSFLSKFAHFQESSTRDISNGALAYNCLFPPAFAGHVFTCPPSKRLNHFSFFY